MFAGFLLETTGTGRPHGFGGYADGAQGVGLEEAEYPHRACRGCEQWDVVKEPIRIREMLEKAIASVESDIGKNRFKPSLAEFLKLMSLRRRRAGQIKEIRVTWVCSKARSEKSE